MASNIMFYYDFEDFLHRIFGTDMLCIIEACTYHIYMNMTAFFS